MQSSGFQSKANVYVGGILAVQAECLNPGDSSTKTSSKGNTVTV